VPLDKWWPSSGYGWDNMNSCKGLNTQLGFGGGEGDTDIYGAGGSFADAPNGLQHCPQGSGCEVF
jgi:hypothetical protein